VAEDFVAGAESDNLSGMGRGLVGLSGHAGDLNFTVVTVGFNVDGDHILAVIGDDGAAVLIGRRHLSGGKF
jgi:hypothetical protein